MLERMPKMGRALEIAGALALPLILYPLILLSLLSNALGAAKRALLGCVEEEAGASSSAAIVAAASPPTTSNSLAPDGSPSPSEDEDDAPDLTIELSCVEDAGGEAGGENVQDAEVKDK